MATDTGSVATMTPVLTTARRPLLSDNELISRFQASGDERSFIILLERHRSMMRRLLYTLLCGGGEEGAVGEVEQEVLVALWRSLPRFAFRSSLPTYLYRVCCNVAYGYLRRHRRGGPSTPFDEQLHTPAVADDALERNEERAYIQRTLRRLKPADRMIIHLREFAGHSVEECARIFECRPGTVKAKLHRAKKRLAHILEEDKLKGEKNE